MRFAACSATLALCWLPVALAYSHHYGSSAFKTEDIIVRDVAIIGGGSSGTHAAISLKDKGKSIVVVEKKARLGGHTETYTDPSTGIPVDYGVVFFHNNTIVKNYFNRFEVPLVNSSNGDLRSGDFDFRTGNPVNITRPSPEALGAAFVKYIAFLSQYPALDSGLFLSTPVPDDLLLPFGEFVAKYGIGDVVQTFFTTNQGIGDILTLPVIEVMRVNGLSLTLQGASNSLVTTARHNTSELYGKAQNELLSADSLLLSSEVKSSSRTATGVELVVKTPSGKKLIRAKKLLITIPPRLEFLHPFHLDHRERAVFTKLINFGYYTSIIKDTGIPDDVMVWNYAQDTPYNLPQLPGIYLIGPNGIPGMKNVYYSSQRSNATFPIPDSNVKADIVTTIKRLQAANPGQFNKTDPEFVVYSSHAPFYLGASPEDTKKGIYAEMYALQGLRNTYWSGAAWRAQDSSMLWKFNEEVVLPQVLAGL
ncbi:putative FAD dependent oxidoreductase [Ophiobolus disseminans]|uniref:Putative FAD dependent oxidoreductase n=1 Tax=Ophiobolus disseminans TaxID=1469910 RepID=A0A6A6ZI25_9PLEO|nr:putative FAD dependent oxidoreductase [Ophiobolus disseminans]